MTGKLITIEGMTGMGKTYYFNLLRKIYKDKYLFNLEITDDKNQGISKVIYGILSSTNNMFFDLGNPQMETLLIAARQASIENNEVKPNLAKGNTVISDRGFDSICILEGLMLGKKNNEDALKYIEMLYGVLPNFILVPDKTILLTGDYYKALERAQEREQRIFTKEEKEILKNSYDLYHKIASKNEDRFDIIDVEEDEEKVVKKLRKVLEKEGIVK